MAIAVAATSSSSSQIPHLQRPLPTTLELAQRLPPSCSVTKGASSRILHLQRPWPTSPDLGERLPLCCSITVIARCRRSRRRRALPEEAAVPARWGPSPAVLELLPPEEPKGIAITLSPDMRTEDVIRILLRSNALCIEAGDPEDGVFYVRLCSQEEDPAGKSAGLFCISLRDLLEAPRNMPLVCLLGSGDPEQCDLYSSGPEPYTDKDALSELASRLPWLAGLLIFLTVSSAILEYYDAMLQRHLVIAFYLTALVGCGGNSGSQAAALVLQALATGELVPSWGDIFRVLRKELLVALGIAVALSVGVGVRILLFGGPLSDALAIALSMAVTVLFSVVFGACAPLFLQRLGANPAKVSGPLLSTVIDIAGVLVACVTGQLLEALGAWS
eukprot:TRINITY_DN96883_c0_g1_i1.p1 TRINITY_DN96883_c0_g1~~TRINITY_DN96883_c0_g1_i1.p1  ORF type:complete len:388 (-),score=62.86 TRINITY_DN96883_c0_g1_i1:217-1380(-)